MRDQLIPLWEETSWPTLSPLHREMARLIGDFGVSATSDATSLVPRTDAEETDTHYLLSFDLPGMNKENINIEFNENQITVSAKRSESKQSKDGKMHIRERYEGEFKRTLKLPESIDVDKIEADYHNGVLRISVPKAENAKPKRITISEGKTGFFEKLVGYKNKEVDDSNVKKIKAS